MKTTREDYMRTIYAIHEGLDDPSTGVKSSDVAQELTISRASVSEMLKKLAEQNFIRWERYGKIHFTNKGLSFAQKVMYIHRVIEVFLVDVLNVPLDEVHEEAHRLEHAFSYETVKRLDTFLKNPSTSPSSKEIPVPTKK